MAKVYLEQLNRLFDSLSLGDELDLTALALEGKHFFNGAALYADEKLCVSLSPAGLAFKLQEAAQLIENGNAKSLKYFDKGHVKQGYALFTDPDLKNTQQWREYFITAIQQTMVGGS